MNKKPVIFKKFLIIEVIILFINVIFQPSLTTLQIKNNIDMESELYQPPIYDLKREFNQEIWNKDRTHSRQTDYGFFGINYTGWTPPDPIIAAGPEHLVVMTNGAIAFFQKDGTMDFQDEIGYSDGFWGEQGAMDMAFDPEVIYDPHSNRFMAMACEGDQGRVFFLLAISDDMDPNGLWHKYRIDVTDFAGKYIDSPNIGVNSQAVFLSALFGLKDHLFILEKEPLLNGSDYVVQHMPLTFSSNKGLPVIYGNPPALYMIEHFEEPTNTIVRLHAIIDPLGTPQRIEFDLTVPAYSPPEYPPQNGTSQKIITFDSRFWSCVWRDGSLWATHHQGTSRVMARWYEIKTNNWPISGTPELYQSGDIDPGPKIRTFFTAIAPDMYGNAAMCFARSSPDEYISMARCMRLVDDPLGTMRDVVIVKESSAPYNKSRWGDYSGVSCDPSDNLTFWMHGEYTPGGDIWNTWISSCKGEIPTKLNINGPMYGKVGKPLEYNLILFYPEDYEFMLYMDWNDGTTEWIGPYETNQELIISHTYNGTGNYTIKAVALCNDSNYNASVNILISNITVIGITVYEAWDLLTNTSNGIQIPIDIRTDEEWNESFIDTSYPENPVHFTLERLKTPKGLKEFIDIYKDKEIAPYSFSNIYRFLTMLVFLGEANYSGTIYQWIGGFNAWVEAGFPTRINDPPTTPIVDGPIHGKPGIEYEFTFNASDLNHDPFMYFVDWGDNNIEWTEYINSDEEITLKHTWIEKGLYKIKTKTKDIYNAESGWEYHWINIPRNRASPFLWYQLLLERFPFIERIINLISLLIK